MNKTELRIGNMIRDIESGRIGTVLTLGAKKCTVKMEFSKLMQDYDEFEPIPLSEEWLLKCGFQKVEHTFWITGLAVHNNTAGEFYVLYEQNRTIISSVHQLQNLVHSLTGEELTIKN